MSLVSLSLPSAPAPLLTVLHKLLPTLPPTVLQVDVPPVDREASVLSGYRRLGLSRRHYALSLFQMHNHTVRVWCPLLAAAALVIRFLFFVVLQAGGVVGVRLWSPEGAGVSVDPGSAPLLLYVLSVVFSLGSSAAFLLLHPHSRPLRSALSLLDSVGRGLHLAGPALALSVYSSDTHWRDSAVGQLYLPTASVLSWLCCAAGCCVEVSRPCAQLFPRRLLLGGSVALAFLLGITPMAQRLYTCSWTSSPALYLHAFQLLLLLLAAWFFLCPVPELLAPGRFDLWGHSLQLAQALLSLSAVCQQEALLQDFSMRRAGLLRRLDAEESLLWACAGFTAVPLSCSITALTALKSPEPSPHWLKRQSSINTLSGYDKRRDCERIDLEPVMGLELDLTWCTMGLVLLVLAVLLSALCTHCGRHSFELRDTTPEKGPSALIKVVKLEEAGEHTSANKDGTDGRAYNIPPWRSHLGSGTGPGPSSHC
uniref:Uncharacterized protein n=1 Tax=Knipowitschia caucasica TaxID=637954 RepID=A0AAV2LLV2_KNICA